MLDNNAEAIGSIPEYSECMPHSVSPGGLVSKNVWIGRNRTSMRLEPVMWMALTEISRREGCTIHQLCTRVHREKAAGTGTTAAVRSYIVRYLFESVLGSGAITAG